MKSESALQQAGLDLVLLKALVGRAYKVCKARCLAAGDEDVVVVPDGLLVNLVGFDN